MSTAKLSEKIEEIFIQKYVKCPAEKRFMLLNTLLRKNVDKKVFVVCSSVSTINFLTEFLDHFKVSVSIVHENMSQSDIMENFKSFSDAKEFILLGTEKCVTPLKGLALDWFVQYDPPTSLGDYYKLLKSLPKSTQKLLFLQSNELGFLTLLQKKNINSSEFEIKWSKVANIRSEVQKLTSRVYTAYMAAMEGYRAFVKFYAVHQLKEVFNIESLDLTNTALGFGLRTVAPVCTEAARSVKRMAKDSDEPTKKIKMISVIKELKPVKPKRRKIFK